MNRNNSNKSDNLMSLLQGMKQDAQEELSLIQFRVPAAFKKEVDQALKSEGLWPRDLFVAAAQLLIRNHKDQARDVEPEPAEKPKQTVLLRKSPANQ